MSPTLPGQVRPAKERAVSDFGNSTCYFHDLDPLRSYVEDSFGVVYHDATTQLGELNPHSFYVVSALDHDAEYHLRAALILSGSRLAGAIAEGSRRSSIYQGGGIPRGKIRGRLRPPQPELSTSVTVKGEVGEENRITADYDYPITGTWLANAYQAIFKPLDREDVDLDFDPDDYPLV